MPEKLPFAAHKTHLPHGRRVLKTVTFRGSHALLANLSLPVSPLSVAPQTNTIPKKYMAMEIIFKRTKQVLRS